MPRGRRTVGTIVQHIVVQKMMNRVSNLSHSSQALRIGESVIFAEQSWQYEVVVDEAAGRPLPKVTS